MAAKRKREQELERVGIDEPDMPRKVPKNLVSLENASDQCWLVKVAPSVWKAWEGLDDGTDLGSLVVRTTTVRRPDGTVEEEETMVVRHGALETKFKNGTRAKLPEYHLSGKRDIEDALVFTTPPAGQTGPPAIVSTIKRQYLMQPKMGKSYDTLVKQRLVSNTIKERTTEAVAMSDVHKAARMNMTRKGTAFDTAFHEAQQAKLEAKGEVGKGTREKMDPKELRSRLFDLFSKKNVYMVKEINRELQQSEKVIREALQEIARMHTSGQHRNHWELKPEFKAGGVGMSAEGTEGEDSKGDGVDGHK